MKEEVITIQNLKCNGCVKSIVQMFGVFPEIKKVKVDLETATVFIQTDLDYQRPAYEAALTRAGYPPEGTANPLHRKAKSFVSCAIGKLEKD